MVSSRIYDRETLEVKGLEVRDRERERRTEERAAR